MARANDLTGHVPSFGAGDTCKVMVFSEDHRARERAIHMCEQLLAQFGEDLDFEFGWWRLSRLADVALARRAAVAAATANIVLFCVRDGDLPAEAADWLESWSESGMHGEGVLALVSASPPDASSPVNAARLEHAAQRLGFDFIRFTPQETEPSPPWISDASPSDPYTLDIRHWGLNE